MGEEEGKGRKEGEGGERKKGGGGAGMRLAMYF